MEQIHKNTIAFDIGEAFFDGSHFLRSEEGVSKLVYIIASNVTVLLGVVMVFLIVSSGISMISSSGNPQEYQRAQNTMTSAIIGFVIAIASWFIVKWIERSFALNILS